MFVDFYMSINLPYKKTKKKPFTGQTNCNMLLSCAANCTVCLTPLVSEMAKKLDIFY